MVFTDNTRRRALPDEVSIHTVEMIAIKVALKDIYKKENKRWVIYTMLKALYSPSNTIKNIT